MTDVDFTPQRERARHEAIVARAARAQPGRPLWVLCPREPLAAALEARLAREGGGFARIVAWEALLDAVDDALGLPALRVAGDGVRAGWIGAALEARAAASTPLAAALRVDGYGIALAALRVVDELRLAGWTGSRDVAERACEGRTDAASALVREHLELLADLVAALERGLAESGAVDGPSRLRRALDAARAPRLAAGELVVEGTDRLAPLERALLERVADGGARVDVAPWVVGWRRAAARPPDLQAPPRNAIEAYARAPGGGACARDDDSVVELAARDPDDEAEHVARWVGGLDPAARRDVALVVPAEPGYAARVARALARYGVEAGYACQDPVHATPLWQVVRACVRLAWRGPDAVDLATALSAPGAGIWGADRDRLVARLRARVPTAWGVVREELARATDPSLAAARDEPRRTGAGDDGADEPAEIDPERARQLAEARARVEELVALWESAPRPWQLPPSERPAAAGALLASMLERFANPMRFREAFDDARVAAAWTASARAIGDAVAAVVAAPHRRDGGARWDDASAFLAQVERLLGSAPATLRRRRGDVVPVVVDAPFLPSRPGTLVVLGFQRGRYPAQAAPSLLLGPIEREALARAKDLVPGLAEVADEGLRAALLERDARRALALPRDALVLVSPRRDATGRAVEPALARRDVLAAYPPDVATARARAGPAPLARWVDAQPRARRTDRAALRDAAALAGAGDVAAALPAVAELARRGADAADVFAARFLPDATFALGDVVRARLGGDAYSLRALETLLKCRYAFVAASLLRLRDLPLLRAPSLSAGDRAAIAAAALAAVDASATDAQPAARDAAVDAAVGASHAGVLEAEDVRRTVGGFLDRYAELRERLGLGPAAPAPLDEGRAAARVTLPTREAGAPREITIEAELGRIETRRDASGERAVLVDLRVGGVDKLAAQREAGLGVGAALLPVIAEQKRGVRVAAVANVSVGKPEADVVARAGEGESFPPRTGRTAIAVDKTASLDALKDTVLANVAKALDEIARDGGETPPHTRERRRQLERAGVRTCEWCDASLLCRFDPEATR